MVYLLFGKQHLAGDGLSTAGEAVEIDTAGYGFAAGIFAIPDHGVLACFPGFIHQFLSLIHI